MTSSPSPPLFLADLSLGQRFVGETCNQRGELVQVLTARLVVPRHTQGSHS